MRALILLCTLFIWGCDDDGAPGLLNELEMSCEEITEVVMEKSKEVIANDVRIDAIPSDPQLALDHCVADLLARGYRFVDKFPNGILSRYTTTAIKTVALGVGYEDRPLWSKAMLICHEAGHGATEDRMMPSLMVLMGGITFSLDELGQLSAFYLSPSGRLAMELPMYALAYMVGEKMGLPPEYLEGYIVSRSGALHEDYLLPTVSAACIEGMFRAMLAELRSGAFPLSFAVRV